jgi:alginate O-acetyltransferase complex protein AlgI
MTSGWQAGTISPLAQVGKRSFKDSLGMLFTSLQYLIFLPLVVLLYWLVPKQWRLPLLLIASYYFYATWIPAFLLLIVGLTAFNYFLGASLHRAQGNRKALFIFGVVTNLVTLGFFKYTNFLLDTINSLLRITVHTNPGWQANIILPLGISFFVFEFIHYLFEIYRGNEPIRSFVLFALFAAFFPTQIAGPIKRYKDFQAQMQETKVLSLEFFDEGLPLIITGMAKKLLIANNLAILVDMGYTLPKEYGAAELWLFAYAFAFQIYFDFSGYTDIARGSAMLFGYHIPLNFNLPYIAKNMSDFWHRWHISLSTWLRDYLFIPLGGSRGGRWHTNRNLLITMALGGLWHGASWSFMVWGVFHGVALVVHREFASLKEKVQPLKVFVDSRLGNFLSMVLTFNAVCVGWVFFRIHDIGTASFVARRMLTMSPFYSNKATHSFLILRPDLPVIVPIALSMTAALVLTTLLIPENFKNRVATLLPVPARALYPALLVLIMLILMPDSQEPFIYFQF